MKTRMCRNVSFIMNDALPKFYGLLCFLEEVPLKFDILTYQIKYIGSLAINR